VRKTEGGKTEEWIFDLGEDPGEKENLIGREAGKNAASVLREKLVIWEKEVKPVR